MSLSTYQVVVHMLEVASFTATP